MERSLHHSSPNPASAHPCRQFFNVVMLREPLPHVLSLMLNAQTNVLTWVRIKMKDLHANGGFSLPANLEFWTTMAPAVLNNYYTRTLLGK